MSAYDAEKAARARDKAAHEREHSPEHTITGLHRIHLQDGTYRDAHVTGVQVLDHGDYLILENDEVTAGGVAQDDRVPMHAIKTITDEHGGVHVFDTLKAHSLRRLSHKEIEEMRDEYTARMPTGKPDKKALTVPGRAEGAERSAPHAPLSGGPGVNPSYRADVQRGPHNVEDRAEGTTETWGDPKQHIDPLSTEDPKIPHNPVVTHEHPREEVDAARERMREARQESRPFEAQTAFTRERRDLAEHEASGQVPGAASGGSDASPAPTHGGDRPRSGPAPTTPVSGANPNAPTGTVHDANPRGDAHREAVDRERAAESRRQTDIRAKTEEDVHATAKLPGVDKHRSGRDTDFGPKKS